METQDRGTRQRHKTERHDRDRYAMFDFVSLIKKGDGNDGEPDALEKLEMEKKPKIGWN